jgi:cyclophilin family peptidyl-prolyl cis-trans isomerase
MERAAGVFGQVVQMVDNVAAHARANSRSGVNAQSTTPTPSPGWTRR